jgi:hypothetical protein
MESVSPERIFTTGDLLSVKRPRVTVSDVAGTLYASPKRKEAYNSHHKY